MQKRKLFLYEKMVYAKYIRKALPTKTTYSLNNLIEFDIVQSKIKARYSMKKNPFTTNLTFSSHKTIQHLE
jgi:hypothetical protein